MSENPQNTPPEAPTVPFREKRKRAVLRRIGRIIGRTLGIFLAAFVALALVLQLPPVQRWGVKKIAGFLSSELKTTVSITDFSLDFLDEISIGNLYIGNQNAPQDTLVSVGRLRIDVNYLDLFWNIYQLDAIRLENTTVRLKRGVGQAEDNIQFIAHYFDPPKPPSAAPIKQADFRFGQIHIVNLDFSQTDSVEGRSLEVQLKAADLRMNIMNLPKQILDLSQIKVFNPQVKIVEWRGVPLDFTPPPPLKQTLTEAVADLRYTPQYILKKQKEKPFQLLVGAISIENGTFSLDKNQKPRRWADTLLDLEHLKAFDANVYIHNFMFTKEEFTGVVDGISCRESTGFVLTKLTVGDAKVAPHETDLYDLRIETPYSAIGDTFIMRYPKGFQAFNTFEKEVEMEGHIHGSKIRIGDIMKFAPDLESNPFFVKNRNANARIEAFATGTISRLKFNPFDIQLGNGFAAKGTFGSRDLDNKNATVLNLKLDNLQTSMPALRQLIPDFKPPATFDKLGNISFQGRFDGFTSSFATDGRLQSALGNATMNLQLDPTTDTASAFYSGKLGLENFNLGAFTDNKDLGKVSLETTILRGRGITLDKLNLDLSATVSSFGFKNYDYQNLKLLGIVSKKQFKGQFDSRDPNVDFSFDGTLDFASATPIYRFTSDIRRFDLFKTNLIKDDLAVSGKLTLDLAGDKLSNIVGVIDGRNLLIIKDKTEKYALDSLVFKSVENIRTRENTEGGLTLESAQLNFNKPTFNKTDFDTNDFKNLQNSKTVTLQTDLLTAEINGIFALDEIPAAFKSLFAKYHPRLAADLNFATEQTVFNKDAPLSILTQNLEKNALQLATINEEVRNTAFAQRFDLKINVLNSKNWTFLFDKKLDTLRNIAIEAHFDNLTDQYSWLVNTLETHHYDGHKIVEFRTSGTAKAENISWTLQTYNLTLKSGQDFKDIFFENLVVGDTIQLGLTSKNFSEAMHLKTVELNVILQRQDSSYRLSFGSSLSSRLEVDGDFWEIDRDNFILLGKNRLEIKNFEAHNEKGNRDIVLNSQGLRGLLAQFYNFDISFVNQYVNDPRFVFGGKYRIYAAVEDVFKMENFGVSVLIDSFILTGQDRGALLIEANGADLRQPITTHLSLKDDTSSAEIVGLYYPSLFEKHEANSLDATINLNSFPLKTLKLLITEGASGFSGRVDGNVRVNGPLSKLNTNGSLRIRDAEIGIDYLKIPIFIHDETVRITNNEFNATGAKVYDKLGNLATLEGGLTHNRFLDFGLNVHIKSKNFLFLNTTRDDNPLYYGYGIGSGDIHFTGDFEKTDLKIVATAGKGTKITFPFSKDQTANDVGFVVFKTKNQTNTEGASDEKIRDLKGISFDMELSMRPEAEVNLIFDEVAGDNIKSNGTGNIHIVIPRGEGLGMNGEYRIERGDYLFTLAGVISKNFVIRQGGFVRWNGNPLDATIDIDAQYKNLSTAPYNFVAEYVENDDQTKQESRKPTPVILSLKLNGALQHPDIEFDMAFPSLQGALKSYAESKLRLLKQDENELNRQVFGLIVVGGFLPSNLGNSQIVSSVTNTATETVSNLLSSILNKVISEYVTGLDVEVGVSVYQFDKTGALAGSGSGQQFRLRGTYALDDRTTLSGGVGVESGEYVQSNLGSSAFLGGDFIVDYAFSDDRRLKLRLSYTRDQVFEGRRDKPAAGIRFRQEFDSFDELLRSLRLKKAEKKLPESQF